MSKAKRKQSSTQQIDTATPQRRVTCTHCGTKAAHTWSGRTFPNGNRWMLCSRCHKPFVDRVCHKPSRG